MIKDLSKPNESQWSKNDSFQIPGMQIPAFRVSLANQTGVNKNILITTWGGIGDQICAEPTLRYALTHFKDCKITLASHIPEVFSHLKFHDVYDLRKETPIADDYLVFQTNSESSIWNLVYQFMCHNVVQCVDFASLCALRCHLPITSKEIVLQPPDPAKDRTDLYNIKFNKHKHVVVHAGKHWQSKTFPTWWWNRVLESIKAQKLVPVLIGKEVDEGQGTVAVDTDGCIDLRNQTSLLETIWVLQNTCVLVCNDSSPLHMAASSDAFIGFVATAKHQDFITHWRNGMWGWRMKHFNTGGMWDLMTFCPNSQEEKVLDKIDEKTLLSWLPEPEVFGPWCKEKINEYRGEV